MRARLSSPGRHRALPALHPSSPDPRIWGLLGQRGAPPPRGRRELRFAPAAARLPPQVRTADGQEGGSTPGWHFCPPANTSAMGTRTREGEREGAGGVSAAPPTAGGAPTCSAGSGGSPAAGTAGGKHEAGEQTKRGEETPSPKVASGAREGGRKGRRAPRRTATGYPSLPPPRGALPRGHGGLGGGPRKRKFALVLLLLPPASATEEPARRDLPPPPNLAPGLPGGSRRRSAVPSPLPIPYAPPPPRLLTCCAVGRSAGRQPPRRAPRDRQVSGGREGGRGKGRDKRRGGGGGWRKGGGVALRAAEWRGGTGGGRKNKNHSTTNQPPKNKFKNKK